MNTGNTITTSLKRLQNKLRPVFIALLALLFMIPLTIVEGVVRDRTVYRDEAVTSISNSWAGNQTLVGPLLVIPYTQTNQVENFNTATNKIVVTSQTISMQRFAIPEDLNIDSNLKTETRARGLYKVPVYVADVNLQGAYKGLNKFIADLKADKNIKLQQPYLAITISDIRGIGSKPEILLNGKSYDIGPGSRLANMTNGIHIPLAETDLSQDDINFNIKFSLKGLMEFNIAPVGTSVTTKIHSDWQHPSFKGQFLPDSREIGANGFNASWTTGLLATNIMDSLNTCILNAQCYGIDEKISGVSLFQPTDIYKQSTRSIKYGLLFVAITFALFFIIETMKGVHVSLPQFLLVGGALAIFFLLLVSLSEHIGFALAYLLASAAIITLLTYYVSFVLRSRKQGLQTGGMLVALYGVLYVILLSEDYALLMGSLLLFLLIAVTMIVTRNVDWENIGQTAEDKKIP